MPLKKHAFILVTLFVAIGLTACGGQGGPAQTVEAYLRALAEKDKDRVLNLSCADWEASASVEVDSLEAVAARLEDLSCEEAGAAEGFTLVSCSGNLVLTYEGEDRPLELNARTYQTLQEGGEWLMCGYR
jgi:hypothetical protein